MEASCVGSQWSRLVAVRQQRFNGLVSARTDPPSGLATMKHPWLLDRCRRVRGWRFAEQQGSRKLDRVGDHETIAVNDPRRQLHLGAAQYDVGEAEGLRFKKAGFTVGEPAASFGDALEKFLRQTFHEPPTELVSAWNDLTNHGLRSQRSLVRIQYRVPRISRG